MTTESQLVFLLMVFAAAALLAAGLLVPSLGGERGARKRLQRRVKEINQAYERPAVSSLLRAEYLRTLSPVERWLESLPGMERVRYWVEQTGRKTPAYRVVLAAVAYAAAAAVAAWMLTRLLPAAGLAGAVAAALPFLRLIVTGRRRLERFEEQLPDALDVIARALRAGHPFAESLSLVGQEMRGPVADEFRLTFADLNYGNDARTAMLNLLARVPSTSVLALVTSVLVQRETGGNLAEILDKSSRLIRGRFRFQRRVRTLSAEGRMSAWVLGLIPFVLVALLAVTSPSYLPMLTEDPLGRKLILGAFVMLMIGVLWMRTIIRIRV